MTNAMNLRSQGMRVITSSQSKYFHAMEMSPCET
jgi:hypothetical protein